ncbi:MAG: hypothetical protein AAF797_13925 [Planctomycetota bacterium]
MSTETLEAPAEQSVESRLDELLERINTRGDDPVEGLPPPPKDPPPVAPSPTKSGSAASPGDALLDQQIDATLAAAAPASAAGAGAVAGGVADPRKPNSSRDAHSALDEQLSALLDDAQAEAQITQSLPETVRPPHAEPEVQPEAEAKPEPVANPAPPVASDGPSINHKTPAPKPELSRPEARAGAQGQPMLDDGSALVPATGTAPDAPADGAAMSIAELDDLIAGEEVEGEFETVDAVVEAEDPLPGVATESAAPASGDALGYSFSSVDEITGAVGLDDEPAAVPVAEAKTGGARPDRAWFAALFQSLLLKLAVMPDVIGRCRVGLGWLNLPAYRLPVWARQALGLAGLITVFNALALLVYAVIA